MGTSQKFTAEQVIEAIRGSGGIKATIAKRLDCHRHTVDAYLERYSTCRQAYEAEAQATDDLAESIVIGNLMLARRLQVDQGIPVDSSDAKWWLERRRRDRFSTRQELTGPDGGQLVPKEETALTDSQRRAMLAAMLGIAVQDSPPAGEGD